MSLSPPLFEEIGRLCSAWAYLETRTEQTIWGILGVQQSVGKFITWRLDMRARWELLLQQAPSKHDSQDITLLRAINKGVVISSRDRNIIVHGGIHAMALLEEKPLPGTTIDPAKVIKETPACWTIYRGADAGKNFPASAKVVETVRTNIQTLARRVTDFNNRHGYLDLNPPSFSIESDWPVPLE